jgi:hypothetical protein
MYPKEEISKKTSGKKLFCWRLESHALATEEKSRIRILYLVVLIHGSGS